MAELETKVEQTESEVKETEVKEEKKYSDTELNAISLKNSNKAIKKMLGDLGIEDTDEGRASAKEILAKAKAEAAKKAEAAADGSKEKLSAAINKAVQAHGMLALVARGVPADKAGRFAKLLDLSGVADEGGEIDEDKLKTAVEDLLKEWPEALPKAEEKIGFKVGSNGKETKESDDDEMDKWRKKAGLKK